jgi:hypothetical protein
MDKTKYALNGLEIRALNPDAKVMKYTELYDYDSVEELFKDTRKVIILYLMINDSVGHWTTLFLNQDGINFFDPYGVPPDYELELLSKTKRKQLDQEQDYLKNMLKPYKVIFNNITYQRLGTMTCGCFVSHRLFYSHLNDTQYFSIFADSHKKPDELVADWCFSKLKNLM